MNNRERARKRIQRKMNYSFARLLVMNLLVVIAIMFATIVESIEVSGNNKIEDESNFIVYESEKNDHNTETSSANALNMIATMPEVKFSRNLSEENKYLLAKIAMAEAEGESIETKVYVILTVLNRVESKQFPNTIEDVILQNRNNVYQFSPVIPGGRWYKVEPNQECRRAVEIVNEMEEDISMGALYFESCKGESWHSKNLEFLFKSDNMRFYK